MGLVSKIHDQTTSGLPLVGSWQMQPQLSLDEQPGRGDPFQGRRGWGYGEGCLTDQSPA